MNAMSPLDAVCEAAVATGNAGDGDEDDEDDGVPAASSAPTWQMAAVTYHLRIHWECVRDDREGGNVS